MKYLFHAFTLVALVASHAHASMSVFGNGTTTYADGVKEGPAYTPSETTARGSLGMGAGVAQVITSDGVVLKSSAQTNVGGSAEILLSPYAALEAGAVVSAGLSDTSKGKQYGVQQVHVPVGARLYLTKAFSIGGHLAAVLPMGERNEDDLQTTNIGAGASMRYLVPTSSKGLNWIFQLSAAKGLFNLGDAGVKDAQLRGMMATAGISADL